jgi:ABC-2 type transport system permease protein
MKRYWSVYFSLVVFTLKSMLEYRLNFLMQVFYAPAYTLVLYFILTTVYSKTTTLAGWTSQQGMVLFSVFHLLYMTFYFFFMKGMRHLLWSAIRQGELDFVLTKPINPQFYLSISKPYIELLPLLVILVINFIYQLVYLPTPLTWFNLGLFCLTFVAGILIAYLSLSSYATIGFYASKAAQVIELFDKASDYSQYPNPVFPSNIRLLTFTLMPIAFFSYIPTLFLLGKGTLLLFLLTSGTVFILIFINRWLWRRGLQHYSSASS